MKKSYLKAIKSKSKITNKFKTKSIRIKMNNKTILFKIINKYNIIIIKIRMKMNLKSMIFKIANKIKKI